MVQIREAVIPIDDDFIGPHIHSKVLAAATFSYEEARDGLENKLGKGVELTPKMRDDLTQRAQKLLAVLSMEEEVAENISLSEEELSEIKAYIESDVKNTWKGRDKIVKTESGEAETPLDFYKRVYAKWIPRLTRGQLLNIDETLYSAFDRWKRMNNKNNIPNEILPSLYRKLESYVPTQNEIQTYNRVNSYFSSRSQRKRRNK